MKRKRPSKGKTATRWRDVAEAKAFVEVVEDIRYCEFGERGGKKKMLTWKEVLRELHRQGYDIHKDESKLKADYKVAKDYAETFYNGRPFSSPSSRKSEAR